MSLRELTSQWSSLLSIASLAVVLVACGNKGDLFLIPDEFSAEELQELEQILQSDDMPGAEPMDVDDQYQVDERDEEGQGGKANKPAAH